jgi:hypothetical protein
MKSSASTTTLKGTLLKVLVTEGVRIGTAIGAKFLVKKIQRHNYEQLPWWRKVFTPYPR